MTFQSLETAFRRNSEALAKAISSTAAADTDRAKARHRRRELNARRRIADTRRQMSLLGSFEP